MAITALDGRTVPKYINPLPILLDPSVTLNLRSGGNQTLYINQANAYDFGLDPLGTLGVDPAKVWGYGTSTTGSAYLGPTIVAQKDNPLYVTWINNLVDVRGNPLPHLLPVDTSLHWANPLNWDKPDVSATQYYGGPVPIVTHLHGGHTQADSDGNPDAWFTPDTDGDGLPEYYGDLYNPVYTYANDQEAGTLWYHDHALGITRLNVYAGLAGYYILRDDFDTGLPDNPTTPENENPLNLPVNYIGVDYTGDGIVDPNVFYEIPLVIQDKLFYGLGTTDDPNTPWLEEPGQLFYPASNADLVAAGQAPMLPATAPNPSAIPEFASANVILVNGKAWPVLNVEPRQYRFRVLNGSDSRFYTLSIPSPLDGMPVPITQIGLDDGLLNAPVNLPKFGIGPGERRDIVIDFSGLEGQQLILQNIAAGQGTRPIPNNPQTTGRIMAFQVSNTVTVPDNPLPATLRGGEGQPELITLPTTVTPIDKLDHTFGNPVIDPLTGLNVAKQVVLFEGLDEYGRIQPKLGTVKDGALLWDEPTTELMNLGDTEIWEIFNATPDAHPIHLHLVSFQLVSRQKYKADIGQVTDPITGAVTPTGPLSNIKYQGAVKGAAPEETGPLDTLVVQPGEVVRIAANFDKLGEYVWHCHILSHEDHEMMRRFEVIAPAPNSSNLIESNPLTAQFTTPELGPVLI